MQTATAVTQVDALRTEFRRLAHGPAMPRLWHRLRHEWQCAADRKVARTVRRIGHPGVQEDYCRTTGR